MRMSEIDDIASTLHRLAGAKDRVAAAREIVLARGGVWADDPPASGLFEIQLLGLPGIGSTAETAVKDWIVQAEAVLATPLTRSA